MKPIPFLIGSLAGLGLAFALNEGLFGLIVFGVSGVLAGWFAGLLAPGSERVYWLAGLVTIGLLFSVTLGVEVPGQIAFAPIVLILAYFIARIAGGVTGQLGAAKS